MANTCPSFRSIRSAFTIVELLVVITLMVVLITSLMPAVSRAREVAMLVQCGANQRGIFQSSAFYSNDYKDRLPQRSGFARYAYADTNYGWGRGDYYDTTGGKLNGMIYPQATFIDGYTPFQRIPNSNGNYKVFRNFKTMFQCPRGYTYTGDIYSTDYFFAAFGAHVYRYDSTDPFYSTWGQWLGHPHLSELHTYQGAAPTFVTDMANHINDDATGDIMGNTTIYDGSVKQYNKSSSYVVSGEYRSRIRVANDTMTPTWGGRPPPTGYPYSNSWRPITNLGITSNRTITNDSTAWAALGYVGEGY